MPEMPLHRGDVARLLHYMLARRVARRARGLIFHFVEPARIVVTGDHLWSPVRDQPVY